jgi:hypothetical protein
MKSSYRVTLAMGAMCVELKIVFEILNIILKYIFL